MQTKAKIFLASDHHFFHDKLLEFGVRGKMWNNIHDHNEALIDNHNSVVGTEDKMFFGGDLVLSVQGDEKNLLHALNITVRRMNGKKYLILGNHCTPAKVKVFVDSGIFAGVCGYWEFKKTINLSHMPLHESQMRRWKLNIHGHVHEDTLDDPRYYNISMEAINYTPITLDQIIDESKQKGVL